MSKKIISIRLSEDLLEKMDSLRKQTNNCHLYMTKQRNYYDRFVGYVSRADVIELALEEYLKNHDKII